MQDPRDATTATHFPTRKAFGARRWRLTQHAPGPEAPDSRDRVGAQKGMIILLAGGLAFWGGVAAVVAHLLH